MNRPITTKQHAFLDYLSTVIVPFLPKLLGAKAGAKSVFGTVAAMTAGQTAVTDFEGGKMGLIPMQAHLATDAMVGVGLLGAAMLMKNESTATRTVMAGLGLFCLAAAVMTDPIPEGKGRAYAERTARLVKKVAGERAGELAGA